MIWENGIYPSACPICGGKMIAKYTGKYEEIREINDEGKLSEKTETKQYPVDRKHVVLHCSCCGGGWVIETNEDSPE